MNIWSSRYLPYFILLVSTCFVSWFRWPILKRADRWICLLLTLTLLQESIALYFNFAFKNNFVTYHIYTPIELFFICIYFDLSLKVAKPFRLSFFIGIPAAITSILLTVYIQKIDKFNSYFLLIEGLIIITLCLIAFYKLLIREDVVPKKMTHFWITMAFLLYWSSTYLSLGLFSWEVQNKNIIAIIIAWALYIPNLLFYTGLLFIFIFYKRLLPSGE